jgi:phage gp16-like protein
LASSELSLLRVAKGRLALSEEDYRDTLEQVGGSRSARELDERGFDAVMDRFRAMGFTSSSRAAGYGDRLGMASAAQLDMIRGLWAETHDSEDGLTSWIAKYFRASHLRFLDRTTASRVIAALKTWRDRRAAQNA